MQVRRARFTIWRMMVAVVVAAVGFVALRQPLSSVWASLMFTLTMILLLTATIGSLFNREPSWAGFALFGWTFMFLAFGPTRRSDGTPFPAPLSTILLKALSVRFRFDDGIPGHTKIDIPFDASAISSGNGGLSIPYAFLTF